MIKFYELTEDGRIAVTADTGRLVKQQDGTVAMEGETFDFPEDFDFSKQSEYRLVQEELVHEPRPAEEPEPSTEERIDELEQALELLLSGVTE